MRHLRYVLGTHGPTRRTGGAHVARARDAGAVSREPTPRNRPRVDRRSRVGRRGSAGDNVMKAWSLVSLRWKRLARSHSSLSRDLKQARVPRGQQYCADEPRSGDRRLFASVLHSASFAKVNVAQPWISTPIKAPQPTRRCQVVVLAPLLVRRWHILRDGASADAGLTKIALRGHRLS